MRIDKKARRFSRYFCLYSFFIFFFLLFGPPPSLSLPPFFFPLPPKMRIFFDCSRRAFLPPVFFLRLFSSFPLVAGAPGGLLSALPSPFFPRSARRCESGCEEWHPFFHSPDRRLRTILNFSGKKKSSSLLFFFFLGAHLPLHFPRQADVKGRTVFFPLFFLFSLLSSLFFPNVEGRGSSSPFFSLFYPPFPSTRQSDSFSFFFPVFSSLFPLWRFLYI